MMSLFDGPSSLAPSPNFLGSDPTLSKQSSNDDWLLEEISRSNTSCSLGDPHYTVHLAGVFFTHISKLALCLEMNSLPIFQTNSIFKNTN